MDFLIEKTWKRQNTGFSNSGRFRSSTLFFFCIYTFFVYRKCSRHVSVTFSNLKVLHDDLFFSKFIVVVYSCYIFTLYLTFSIKFFSATMLLLFPLKFLYWAGFNFIVSFFCLVFIRIRVSKITGCVKYFEIVALSIHNKWDMLTPLKYLTNDYLIVCGFCQSYILDSTWFCHHFNSTMTWMPMQRSIYLLSRSSQE